MIDIHQTSLLKYIWLKEVFILSQMTVVACYFRHVDVGSIHIEWNDS